MITNYVEATKELQELDDTTNINQFVLEYLNPKQYFNEHSDPNPADALYHILCAAVSYITDTVPSEQRTLSYINELLTQEKDGSCMIAEDDKSSISEYTKAMYENFNALPQQTKQELLITYLTNSSFDL